VEPASLTLGAIVAGLVAKASERATDRAVDTGEGALRRLVARVRERFRKDEDATGSLMLAQRAPDSALLIGQLAEQIARYVNNDREFGTDLASLVAESERADARATLTANGNRVVQVADAPGSIVTVNYNS
jgi:hypothetical protein